MPQPWPSRRLAARLDSDVYRESGHVAHVIVCVHGRQPHFAVSSAAGVVTGELAATAARWGSTLYCWCVMPDHVHVVLTPGRAGSGDLRRLVGGWKAAVSRQLGTQGPGETLWQRGFWDHFLRQEEDLRTVCEYVLANPERSGLVERWQDWPHSWLNPEI
jgi:REP element-mobilizing transposase RayT